MFKASIIICSKDRPQELNRCLASLKEQTYKHFEQIVIDKDAPLSYCRDLGWRSAKGDIVIFIDDDVVCPPLWLHNIILTFFNHPNIVGVTGATLVPQDYLNNRDVFKYNSLYKFFNKSERPGYISKWGVPSMYSNYSHNYYLGYVQYLECCNMALKRKVIKKAGGFDLTYEKTSEWCEVDLAMRCSRYGKLLFNSVCGVYHLPSKQGAYKDRLDTAHRYRNYLRFCKRHLPNSWRIKLYQQFFKWYLKWKKRH